MPPEDCPTAAPTLSESEITLTPSASNPPAPPSTHPQNEPNVHSSPSLPPDTAPSTTSVGLPASSATAPSDTTTNTAQNASIAGLATRKGPKGARHIQPKKEPTKRGRKSSWPLKKLAWLESHVPQFISSDDHRAFYNRIVFLWKKIFGRDLPLKEDPEGEIDEAAAIARPDPEENLTPEERKQRCAEDRHLREVPFLHFPLYLRPLRANSILVCYRYSPIGTAHAWAMS